MREIKTCPINIISELEHTLGARLQGCAPLLSGADARACAFHVQAEDGREYFLKLRQAPFNPASLQAVTWLRDELGLSEVLAPIRTGRSSGPEATFFWLLYPYIHGRDGFSRSLGREQWNRLGRCLRAMHDAELPPAVKQSLPKPDAIPGPEVLLRRLDDAGAYSGRDRILLELAETCRQQKPVFAKMPRELPVPPQAGGKPNPVLCHGDIHAGNVLLADTGGLYLLDWDDLFLAPREQDLMFIGAGVGGRWNTPEETAYFYEGYGQTVVDPAAVTRCRLQRIVADSLELLGLVQDTNSSRADRQQNLRYFQSQFLPGNVTDMAGLTGNRV